MQVSVEVPVESPADAVWQSLTDVDSVLAALPGAALARDGGGVSGSLKCKLAGSQVTYRLTANAKVGEPGLNTSVISVDGTEARGSGTLVATLTVAVRGTNGDTRIEVNGNVEATGRGASADAAAWERVITLLVNAVVPPVAEPAPAVIEPPRPALSVAPTPVAPTSTPPSIPGWLTVAGIAAVVVLITRRRSRTRR